MRTVAGSHPLMLNSTRSTKHGRSRGPCGGTHSTADAVVGRDRGERAPLVDDESLGVGWTGSAKTIWTVGEADDGGGQEDDNRGNAVAHRVLHESRCDIAR